MDGFTTFLIVLGAFSLAFVFMWVVTRIGAWCDGRPW